MRKALSIITVVTGVACGTAGQDAMTLRQKARTSAASVAPGAPAESTQTPRMTSDGTYQLPELLPSPVASASASRAEPTMPLMAGVKVYFKDPNNGMVYGMDASDVEKARSRGLVPASTEDVKLAIKASETPPGCAMPHGMYTLRWKEREGRCGPRNESLLNWRDDFSFWRIPPGCKGKLDVSKNGCEVSMDYECPKDSARVLIMRWNAEGTKAVSVEQVIEKNCSSTYDVTYTKL